MKFLGVDMKVDKDAPSQSIQIRGGPRTVAIDLAKGKGGHYVVFERLKDGRMRIVESGTLSRRGQMKKRKLSKWLQGPL